MLWRLKLCRRKPSSPSGDQLACSAGQVGTHHRDEFHPLVQDMAAGSHRAGVGWGGPGACGSMKACLGFFVSRAAPQRLGSDPLVLPWTDILEVLARQFHGAWCSPALAPRSSPSTGRWPALQSRLVLVDGEAQREVGVGGGGCMWIGRPGVSLKILGAHGWPATRSQALQMGLAGPGSRGHLVGSKVATGKMVGGWSEAEGRGIPGPVLSKHGGRRDTF